MRNKSLYKSLKTLTRVSIDLMVTSWKTNPHYFREFDWFKQEDGSYMKQEYSRPFWSITLHSHVKEELLETDDYLKFINILEDDKNLESQINSLIGTNTHQTLFDPFTLVTSLTNLYLTDTAILQFDEDEFKTRYLEIEDELYSNRIVTERITPLFGFVSDIESISLSKGISIVKLSDIEIIRLLRAGMKLGFGYFSDDHLHRVYEFAIKITESQPKIIRPQNGDDNLGFHKLSVPIDIEDRIIDILRIYNEGKIFPLGTANINNSIFLSGMSYSRRFPIDNFIRDNYELLEEDITSLSDLWNKYQEINLPDNHFLSLAIRRFSFANERKNIEDKIIDYFICAEALFLSSDLESVQGELNYRLSHRSAMFIESDSYDQITTAKFMRKAYGVRSNIVHGSKIKLPSKADGTKYTFEELCKELENILRFSINKMIDIFHSSKSNTLNWDTFIFPNITDHHK